MGKFIVLLLLVVSFSDAQEYFELKEIEFKGNRSFSKKDLYPVLISRESPSKFWQLLYKISERLGDKPQYLDKVKVINDLNSLKNFYRDNGFFDAKIDTLIQYYDNKTAKLTFLIEENQPYKIEKVEFSWLEVISDSLRDIALKFNYLKVGGRYTRFDVESEVQRILNLLYDNGYPNAYVDRVKIRVWVDTTRKVVSLFVPVSPDGRFVLKDIKISYDDTTRMKISENLVRRELEFKSGELYNRSLILKSESNLLQTGLFESVKISIKQESVRSDSINFADVNVSILPRNKQDVSTSLYFSDERSSFNVGVSFDYQNRNFLGGGRFLLSSLKFQVQSLSFKEFPTMTDTTNAGLIELDLKLTQPYLLGRKIPGEIGLSTIIDKQKSYALSIVRNRVRFVYRSGNIYSSFFDWDVESVNIKFQRAIDSTLARLYQRQLNSIFGLTLQIDKTDDLIYPRSGYSHTFSIEEGGIVPFLMGKAGVKVLPFSQYYKFTWLYRWFFNLNNSVFAFKFKLGVANRYFIKSAEKFDLAPIPINRRFFAGGSASVRGWRVRELGNIPDPALGGNVLIEANFEDRMIFWRNFGGVVFIDVGNLWDGLKDVKFEQFAVASGFGLRYLTFFGGFRLDFGFKIYDPNAERRLIFRKSGRQILKEMVFHIGVGQTF